MFHAAADGFSTDGMQVGFFDETGARINTLSTDLKFAIIDPFIKPDVFDWSEAPPRGGNFWMVGMFKKIA